MQKMEKIKIISNLSIIQHLEELRKRLIYCLIYFGVGSLIGFLSAKKLIKLIQFPSKGVIANFIVTGPVEAFSTLVKLSIFAGAVFFAFAFIYNAYRFAEPAFENGNKPNLLALILNSFLLFCLGVSFSYFIVLPQALKFLMKVTMEIAVPLISLGNYISFAGLLLLLGGFVFQMPLLAAFLTKVGLLNPFVMRARRKEAIFGLAVASAVLTPTTDIFNMLIFLIPMIILYESSIIVSAIIYSKKTINKTEVIYDTAV
jgi:sec-independent protein translocase protein TatC